MPFKNRKLYSRLVLESPSMYFLGGEEGLNVLEEYNQIVADKFNGHYGLGIFRLGLDEVIRGSNIPSAVLINRILKKKGKRLANLTDILKIFQARRDSALRLSYQDIGIVLRDKKEVNKFHSDHILDRFKEDYGREMNLPALLPIDSLEVCLDPNKKSPDGLVYRVIDESEVISSEILAQPSPYFTTKETAKFKDEDMDEKTGLPLRLDPEGNREFYGRVHGLSRFYLNRFNELDSDKPEFLDSFIEGRILAVEE